VLPDVKSLHPTGLEATSSELTTQLNQERYALRSLLEFVRVLTPDRGVEAIVRSVLLTIMGRSLIKDAFAYVDDGEGTYSLMSRFGFRDEDLPATVSETELAAVQLRTSTAKVISLSSPEYPRRLAVLGFGASLAGASRIESEESYFESLTALTAIALTNARLFERERERERLESELRLARQIQETMLPKSFPTMKGLEFAAVSRPSEWIGGDSYDVIQIDEHRVLFSVADVVGKGVTAALTMSNMQAALRALIGLIRVGHLNLLDTVKELNRIICESTAPERFITAVIGIVDLRRRSAEFAVCGHPSPLILAEGLEVTVESTGIPLGIIDTFPFETVMHRLPENGIILSYTDGLSEARYKGRMIGAEGIAKVVDAAGLLTGDMDSSLGSIVNSTRIEVEDDITLLAIRYTEEIRLGLES
jgi:serine phosphatase RsbU (regulator of sigma subunit)